MNRALHKLPFKVLTCRRIIKCIQPQDWFAAIDLKDAYIHVSILLRHRPFLRFAFKGRAWQYRAPPPQALPVSPCLVEGALFPLREVGVRVPNYLSTGRGCPRTSVLAYCCHNRCLQHRLGRYIQRAGSLGALDGAPTALAHQLPRAVDSASSLMAVMLLGKHVLVRMDNTVAVSYINRLGCIRSHRMSQLARHLLFLSHTQFKSLRAVHILGKLNRAADVLSRQFTFPRE